MERIANLTPQPSINPGEAGYLESLDRARHAKALGLTVLVGRNTLKEYFWGLREGWLVDFDAVQEDRGDERKMQDLKEELDRDGVFDVANWQQSEFLSNGEEDLDHQVVEPPISITSSSAPAIFPPRSAFSFFSKSPSTPSVTEQESSPQEPSLKIAAVTEIPSQPPFLILPFDHPLGRLRHWPIKMFKYLFLERYRVRHGAEIALAILQATHSQSSGFPETPDDARTEVRGIRRIQPPQIIENARLTDDLVKIDDVLTENKKKVRWEWQGDDLPLSGSKDLDSDYYSEVRYRSSFSDTPVSIETQRKGFYEELPKKLKIARELENRDRLPTKEEQKYPPPTEAILRQERLTKEKKWRSDFHGWLMTRVGSKVTWDPRFESLDVLDLDLARQSITKTGFVGDVDHKGTSFAYVQ